jgi:hypothetical protein
MGEVAARQPERGRRECEQAGYRDAGEQRDAAQAGRERAVKVYDPAQVVDRYEAIYRKVARS